MHISFASGLNLCRMRLIDTYVSNWLPSHFPGFERRRACIDIDFFAPFFSVGRVLALPGTVFLPNGTKTAYVLASFSLTRMSIRREREIRYKIHFRMLAESLILRERYHLKLLHFVFECSCFKYYWFKWL
jgi:hypothetical protein